MRQAACLLPPSAGSLKSGCRAFFPSQSFSIVFTIIHYPAEFVKPEIERKERRFASGLFRSWG